LFCFCFTKDKYFLQRNLSYKSLFSHPLRSYRVKFPRRDSENRDRKSFALWLEISFWSGWPDEFIKIAKNVAQDIISQIYALPEPWKKVAQSSRRTISVIFKTIAQS
jgi:hypothetical protein